MARMYKGTLDAAGLRFGLVVSRFNTAVTERLLHGALRALQAHGARDEDVTVVHVSGAFEIPLLARTLADRGTVDAVICLGAIVRGETPHHHHLAQAVFAGLQQLMLDRHLPIALGILTTDNVEQALRRAGDDPGNKGWEAALTAIETTTLRHQLG